jgi:hypothetical protein
VTLFALLLNVVIGAPPPAPAAQALDVVQTAQKLGETRYRDYTYGSRVAEQQIDCVQFLLAVVDDLARQQDLPPIGRAVRAAIAINLDEEAAANLQTLVEQGDPRTTGIQAALVNAGLGVKVAPSEARPGDLVQYWYRQGGAWRGHSGVIESIRDGRSTIYGSHRSTLQRERDLPESQRRGGVGSGPVFDLTAEGRKVYVVRWLGRTALVGPGER